MKVQNNIDNLIKNLELLKPRLSDNIEINKKKFADTLNSALENLSSEVIPMDKISNGSDAIPSWVNPKYAYDPANPRKPVFREVVEALSGKPYNELYYEKDHTQYNKYSQMASDILYGVIGSNADSRDWEKIMTAEDVFAAANEETGKMYSPVIEIEPNYNSSNQLVDQTAVLKDNTGNILSILKGNLSTIEQNLDKYGASSKSISPDIDEKVDTEVFDSKILEFLKSYSSKTEQIAENIQSLIIKEAGETLAAKNNNLVDLLDPNIL